MTKAITLSALLVAAVALGACAPAPTPAPVSTDAPTGKL
jgi:hypothetical protein